MGQEVKASAAAKKTVTTTTPPAAALAETKMTHEDTKVHFVEEASVADHKTDDDVARKTLDAVSRTYMTRLYAYAIRAHVRRIRFAPTTKCSSLALFWCLCSRFSFLFLLFSPVAIQFV